MQTRPVSPVGRIRRGVRSRASWAQLLRFSAVGASGYIANLVAFTVAVHAVELNYRVGAVLAFIVGVTNNFTWNRLWTFRLDAGGGRRRFQAARFLIVSVAAFLFSLLILEVLVAGEGVAAVAAQAIAIVTVTPLNFIGNKLWTFSR